MGLPSVVTGHDDHADMARLLGFEVDQRVAPRQAANAGDACIGLERQRFEVIAGDRAFLAPERLDAGADIGRQGCRGHSRRLPVLAVEQLQKSTEVVVAHPVQPVNQHLGQPGEQLDQGDAGVGRIVVGPFRRVAGDQRARFLDQVGIAAIVEIGEGQRHGDQVSAKVKRMSWMPE